LGDEQMIELNNLGKYRKARLWIDELPLLNDINISEKKIIVTKKNDCEWNNNKIALEVYYPRNSSNYAFLGVEYTRNIVQKNNLLIILNVSKYKAFKFNDSLVNGYDEVYSGIPEEYSNAILESVENTLATLNFVPEGTLKFNLGAYSLIGSSPMVFSKIAEILVRLLNKSNFEMTSTEKFIAELM
jgi:hypothetical protein